MIPNHCMLCILEILMFISRIVCGAGGVGVRVVLGVGEKERELQHHPLHQNLQGLLPQEDLEDCFQLDQPYHQLDGENLCSSY